VRPRYVPWAYWYRWSVTPNAALTFWTGPARTTFRWAGEASTTSSPCSAANDLDGGDVGRVRAQDGAQVVTRQVRAFSDAPGSRGAGSRTGGRGTRSDPHRDLDALVRLDIADDLGSRYLLAAAAGNLDAPLFRVAQSFPLFYGCQHPPVGLRPTR
jgi:hypothetical protein